MTDIDTPPKAMTFEPSEVMVEAVMVHLFGPNPAEGYFHKQARSAIRAAFAAAVEAGEAKIGKWPTNTNFPAITAIGKLQQHEGEKPNDLHPTIPPAGA